MDRIKNSVKHIAAISKFQQFKGDEFPVQDPEFDTYRDKLEAQIKQVDHMQKCLGSFYTSLLGLAQSTLEMGESLETFYGDGNGREVAAKFLLTQLKLKMCSEDLSEGTQQANESWAQYRERLVGMRGKVAVRDEMVGTLHKASILVEKRRRKYEASKDRKLERLAKFDQTVAARDALRAEFEEKNADLKLELMDLDLNRALHVESIVKKMMDDQMEFLAHVSEGCELLDQATAIKTVRVIPVPTPLAIDANKKSEDDEREQISSGGLYVAKEPRSPSIARHDPLSPSSPTTPLSGSGSSHPLSLSTGSAPPVPMKPKRTGPEPIAEPQRRGSACPKPLPRLPPVPSPASGGAATLVVEPEPILVPVQAPDQHLADPIVTTPSLSSSSDPFASHHAPRAAISPTPGRKALPGLPSLPEASPPGASTEPGLSGSGSARRPGGPPPAMGSKPLPPAKPQPSPQGLSGSGSKILPVPPPKPSALSPAAPPATTPDIAPVATPAPVAAAPTPFDDNTILFLG